MAFKDFKMRPSEEIDGAWAMYSKEEYQVLVDLLSKCVGRNHFRSHLIDHINDKPIWITFLRRRMQFKTLTDWMWNRSYYAYKMMYETPLVKIPLKINRRSDLIKAIVRWRLNISK